MLEFKNNDRKWDGLNYPVPMVPLYRRALLYIAFI